MKTGFSPIKFDDYVERHLKNNPDISPAKQGHMATVRAETSVTTDSYSISTNCDNSKYMIEEFSSFSVDGSYREDEYECESVADVMAKVIDLVGKHIGAEQAQSERKNS